MVITQDSAPALERVFVEFPGALVNAGQLSGNGASRVRHPPGLGDIAAAHPVAGLVGQLDGLRECLPQLAERGFTAAELDAECVGRFLANRRSNRRVGRSRSCGLTLLLGYLRGLGVVPAPATAMPGTAQDAV